MAEEDGCVDECGLEPEIVEEDGELFIPEEEENVDIPDGGGNVEKPVDENEDETMRGEEEFCESDNVDDDDEDIDDGDEDGYDEEVFRTFMNQLVQLQKKSIMQKKENRLIPSVTKYLKLDMEEKGQRLTPSLIKNMLHICKLITDKKLNVELSPGDRNIMKYLTSKDCPAKDIKFMLVEDMRIHAYIREAVDLLNTVKEEEDGRRRQKTSVNRRGKIQPAYGYAK